MAMFLPPWQAIKMPISGKIVDTGRFSGFALRFGGSSAVMNDPKLQLKREMMQLKDGAKIFYQAIRPKEKVVTHVCIFLHGYMGSGDLFLHFPAEWARRGALVLVPDLPGHGRSDGLLTYVPDWWAWVDQIWESIGMMLAEEAGGSLPTFVSGASLGGGLAVCLCLKQPKFFQGAILLCPMLTVSDELKPPMGLAPRLGTGREFGFTYPDWLDEHLSEMRTPFIIMHGNADKITDPETSKRLYKESTTVDKTLKLYDGVYHAELLHGIYEPKILPKLEENLQLCPLPLLQIMMDSVLASSVDYSVEDGQGLFELATKLAEQLEEAGLQDVSELRAEWANDTIYTYPLLFGSRHHDCHGFALKIYVYEVPAPLTEKQLDCALGQWGTEVLFHRYLLSSSCRTLEPEEADFFLVPVYSTCLFTKERL
eukprot:g16398.t2